VDPLLTILSPRFPGVIALFLLLLSGLKIRVRTIIYAAVPALHKYRARTQSHCRAEDRGRDPACAVPAARARSPRAVAMSMGRNGIAMQGKRAGRCKVEGQHCKGSPDRAGQGKIMDAAPPTAGYAAFCGRFVFGKHTWTSMSTRPLQRSLYLWDV
jgi:hypothetical protein